MTTYIAKVGPEYASWLASPDSGPLIGYEGEITDNGDGTISVSEGGVVLLRDLTDDTDGYVDEERDEDGWETGMLRMWIGGNPYPLGIEAGPAQGYARRHGKGRPVSVPRYKARQLYGLDDQKTELFDVLDLAADGTAVLLDVPSRLVIGVVNAMNDAYETGVEDGTTSERIGNAGRLRSEG